ncbi:MAG: Uma2 family endonuclease [Pyrinomonadaceae bacterium]
MSQEIETTNSGAIKISSPRSKVTYEEFLAWADEDVPAEWVDGEVIIMSPASRKHQEVASFLAALLTFFVEAKQAGVIFIAPFQMRLDTRPSGREPDILFIARERLEFLTNTYLNGAADMALEIISPESRVRDRGDKFYEYEQAGVREYWLIDPVRKQAEFYCLNDEGIYQLIPVGEDNIFNSRVLDGLRLNVEWLWQEPLPLLMSVLKEWKLI